jgi:hypothetical protein
VPLLGFDERYPALQAAQNMASRTTPIPESASVIRLMMVRQLVLNLYLFCRAELIYGALTPRQDRSFSGIPFSKNFDLRGRSRAERPSRTNSNAGFVVPARAGDGGKFVQDFYAAFAAGAALSIGFGQCRCATTRSPAESEFG